MTYPPFNGAAAELPLGTSTAKCTAECKRWIEEAWRKVGVQVHVTTDNGQVRSNLVNGWPPS